MPKWESGLWQDLPKADRGELLRFLGSLRKRWGPFDAFTREYARLTVETWWTAREASVSAVTVGVKRKHGRGRRPNLQQLDRRLKRQGLGVEALDKLVQRLEELAARNGGHGQDLASRLAAAQRPAL